MLPALVGEQGWELARRPDGTPLSTTRALPRRRRSPRTSWAWRTGRRWLRSSGSRSRRGSSAASWTGSAPWPIGFSPR